MTNFPDPLGPDADRPQPAPTSPPPDDPTRGPDAPDETVTPDGGEDADVDAAADAAADELERRRAEGLDGPARRAGAADAVDDDDED